MFACVWKTKGIIWPLFPNSLTLLRYCGRKYQSVPVEFTWHKWVFFILKWMLFSVSPRCISLIPPSSSPLQVKTPRYHTTNKRRKTLKDPKRKVGCLVTWGTWETWPAKQQGVPSISLLLLLYPGQGAAEVSNPGTPTGTDQKNRLRKSHFPSSNDQENRGLTTEEIWGNVCQTPSEKPHL